MPTFHCPSCGAQAQVGEEFAGKQIVCPKCQQSGPVPTSADATPQSITTPELAHPPLRRAGSELPETMPSIREPNIRGGLFAWLTLGKVLVALSLFIMVPFAIALFMRLTQQPRVYSSRHQSRNNLRQITLAMQGFHDIHKRLPFNGSDIAVDGKDYSKNARPGDPRSGSWAFQILPFIEQQALFDRGPARGRSERIEAYLCPARERPAPEDGAWCDYFYNNYLNDPKQAESPDVPDAKRTLPGISDGTSNTIFAGHGTLDTRQFQLTANVTLSGNIFFGGTFGTTRAGKNGEHTPAGVALEKDSDKAPGVGSWGGPFPQGALMAMADGTVKVFPYNTNNFSAFLTPTGNEAVVLPD